MGFLKLGTSPSACGGYRVMIGNAVWDTYASDGLLSGSLNLNLGSRAYLEEKGITKVYT